MDIQRQKFCEQYDRELEPDDRILIDMPPVEHAGVFTPKSNVYNHA